MALDRLTKITGPGIATDHNWVGNNATFTGVTTTGSSFNVGVTTIHSTLIEAHNIKSTGIITATGAHFSGNVSIAGTLTYEDVTNIDSVGIITAPAVDIDDFLDVGSNIKLGNAGVITATSFVGSGANLTGIDATKIITGNTQVQTIDTGSDGHIKFTTEGSERARILANGNIGIGEDAPVAKVHIAGSNYVSVGGGGFDSNTILALTRNFTVAQSAGLALNSGTSATSFIHLGDADDPDIGKITYDHTNNSMSFTSNAIERLRITSGGEVLIGTTTDANVKLDVEGSLRAKSAGYVAPASGTGLEIYYATNTLNDTPSGYLISYDRSSSAYKKINYDASEHKFRTSGTEKVRIDSTGRVLIGTTTEGYASADDLTVATTGSTGITIRSGTGSLGTIAYSDGTSGDAEYRGYLQYAHNGDFLKIGTAGAEKVRIDSSGRVLIGTTTEGHENANTLTLSNSGTAGMTIRSTSSNCHIYFSDATSGAGEYVGQLGYNHGSDYMFFHTGGSERLRIDSNGVSGTVKNNFLQTEFQRHDTSSQYGPLSTSFATDNNISATISNYQRGQRIIIRATVPCGIALQNGSGANYAGTSARIKVTNGSTSTYSNDRAIWYRADGNGTHETTQNLFICLYINESNTDFSNGNTLTVTIEGKKNSGTGTSTHYIGGWSSVKEITVERYEKSL